MREKPSRALPSARLLAVVAAGLTAGWFLFRIGLPESPVAFEPATLDLRSKQVFVGEVISREARLVNWAKAPVEVEGLNRSCGCMSFLNSTEGQLPRRLQPGESLPIMVEVHTEGRTGPQTFSVQALGRDSQGAPFRTEFTITAFIHSGPLPSPTLIEDFVPPEEAGREKQHEIVLADETGLASYGKPEVTSSAPERFRFEVGAASPGKEGVQGLDLSRRYVLKVLDKLPSNPGDYRESIFVDFPGSRFTRIEIPVTTHVETEVSWSPVQFTLTESEISGANLGVITRVIRFRSHRRLTSMVAELDGLPPGLSARRLTVQDSDTRDLSFELQFDTTTIRSVSQIHFRLGDGRRVTIPVEFF